MEKFYRKLSFLLPKKLVFWSAIRLFSYGTTGKYSSQIVPELTVMEALERWAV